MHCGEVQQFNTATDALQNSSNVTNSDISELRSHGDTYMVDGLEKLYSMTESSELVTNHPFVEANSDMPVPLHVEYTAALKTEGNKLGVDHSTAKPGTVANTVLEHENSAHTHPNHPEGVRRKSGSSMIPGTFDKSPSIPDRENKTLRQKQYGTNKYYAVIGVENIYLFRNNPSGIGGTQLITAPRKFFK